MTLIEDTNPLRPSEETGFSQDQYIKAMLSLFDQGATVGELARVLTYTKQQITKRMFFLEKEHAVHRLPSKRFCPQMEQIAIVWKLST